MSLDVIKIRKNIGPVNKGIDLGLLGKFIRYIKIKNITVYKKITLKKKITFEILNVLIICWLILNIIENKKNKKRPIKKVNKLSIKKIFKDSYLIIRDR